MNDYRKMPLGRLGNGRIGEIVECPYCDDHALEVEDYKYPMSGSTEKMAFYIHYEAAPITFRTTKNGRTVEISVTPKNYCGVREELAFPQDT